MFSYRNGRRFSAQVEFTRTQIVRSCAESHEATMDTSSGMSRTLVRSMSSIRRSEGREGGRNGKEGRDEKWLKKAETKGKVGGEGKEGRKQKGEK